MEGESEGRAEGTEREGQREGILNCLFIPLSLPYYSPPPPPIPKGKGTRSSRRGK